MRRPRPMNCVWINYSQLSSITFLKRLECNEIWNGHFVFLDPNETEVSYEKGQWIEEFGDCGTNVFIFRIPRNFSNSQEWAEFTAFTQDVGQFGTVKYFHFIWSLWFSCTKAEVWSDLLGKGFFGTRIRRRIAIKRSLSDWVPYTTVKGMGQGVGFIGSMDYSPKIVF